MELVVISGCMGIFYFIFWIKCYCCFFKVVPRGRLGGMAWLSIDVLALFPLSFVLCPYMLCPYMLCPCLYKFKKDRDSFYRVMVCVIK